MLNYMFCKPVLLPVPKHGSSDSIAGRSFGICGGQSGIGQVFLLVSRLYPVSVIPPIHSSITDAI